MASFESLCRAHANFKGIIFPHRNALDGVATADTPFATGELSQPSSRSAIPAANFVAEFDATTAISCAMWYKPSAADVSANAFQIEAGISTHVMFFSRTDGSGWRVGGESQTADAAQAVTKASTFTAGQWYFLGFYLNFTGDLIGSKIGAATLVTDAVAFGSNTWTITSMTATLGIGMRSEAQTGVAITGRLYALALFDAALSNAEFEVLRAATSGETMNTVGPRTATFTLDMKTFAGPAAASETGVDIVVLDAATGAAVTRILHVVSGESFDGSGQLVVSLPNSLLNNGDIVLVGMTNTGGTPGVMAKQHFYPVQVTV